MRFPHISRITAAIAAAAALAIPTVGAAQSLATMPLTTQSAEASTAFHEGLAKALMLNTAAATRGYRTAVEKDPGFALARAFRATVDGTLDHAQQLAEVDRAFADAATATATEQLLVMQAREQLYGRGGEAQAIARALKALLPDEGIFYAADLPATATPKETAARWHEATVKFPGLAFALNAYAYTLWTAGSHAAALEAARKQVERFGTEPNPHDSYAELLAWSGDLAGAATHYGHAVERAPDFAEGYVGLAEVAVLRGDMTRARAELQRAIEHTDDPAVRVGYLRQLASTYALEANREATGEQLHKALDAAAALGDTTVMATVTAQLSTLAALQDMPDSAHALAARASAMRPHAQPVYFFTAMTHAVMGHEAPAKAAVAAARAEPNGGAPGVRDRLTAVEGYMAIKAERPKDALAVLVKADTTDLVVLSWIAQANRMLGSAAKADAQFTRIRDDRTLNLIDYAAANARQRARTALLPRAAMRE